MELARGTVGNRPWATTLATLARRTATGQLTLAASDGKRYAIAFSRGMIVAARSPLVADSVARIALTSRLASQADVTELTKRVAAVPSNDEVDVLAALARMPPPQVMRLRSEVILRRAARTFAVEDGEYIFEDQSCLPVHGCEVDMRAVVYRGILQHVSEERLDRELRELGGGHFVLEPGAGDELHRYGFCDGEWPLLAALRDGATLPELEAHHRDIDPRTMRAAIHTLVACGAVRVLAVGRTPTPPNVPRTKTNPELAAEAAERAERALKLDRPETAVVELERACKLDPTDVDHRAMYGWALFCAADDKRSVAELARTALEHAVRASRKPHEARFYLGRVERMLGREQEALGHFHAVLMLQPDHRDASAEIRVLQARANRVQLS